MSRSFACLASLLAALAACGGKVVVDSTSTSGVGGDGSGGTTATGTGGCDPAAHTISPDGYDTSCNGDADCGAVFFGDLCGNCFCPFGAINVGDQAKYLSELSAKAVPPPGIVCTCPASHAVCNAGTCEVTVP